LRGWQNRDEQRISSSPSSSPSTTEEPALAEAGSLVWGAKLARRDVVYEGPRSFS